MVGVSSNDIFLTSTATSLKEVVGLHGLGQRLPFSVWGFLLPEESNDSICRQLHQGAETHTILVL